MSVQSALLEELAELVVVYSSGLADDAQFARLEQLLNSSEEARAIYVDLLDMHASLYGYCRQPQDTIRCGWDGTATMAEDAIDDRPSFPEISIPNVPIVDPLASSPSPPLTFLGSTTSGMAGFVSSGWPVAYLLATVIFGIGLLIGSLVHVSSPDQVAEHTSHPSRVGAGPKAEIVGRITAMLDCRFDQPFDTSNSKTQDPRLKTLLRLGERIALASGLMEITYDTGAKVILQGPVTYEVDTKNGGFLPVGKLTGKVDTETAKGFCIRTPTATVTDLGTEFGVDVSKDGHTTSHVYRGLVRLQAISREGSAEGTAQVLRENQSACVENSGGRDGADHAIVLVASDKPAPFVREIPQTRVKRLDLVDVVAGGDGFSGRRGRGIDPTNGQVLDKLPNWGVDYIAGDGKYHRVQGLPFVDGVFIPDGRRGPVAITSTGLVCDEFPQTSNETVHAVWAGGPIPNLVPSYPAPRTELGRIDYASPGHGLLFLHANKGITFDLAAIRRADPERNLVCFRAVVGNTETSVDKGEPVTADAWVLLDGQVRFRRREINQYTGAFSVAIPIAQNDRFLTLAATDGGNGISWDWILFGDPRLECENIDPEGR